MKADVTPSYLAAGATVTAAYFLVPGLAGSMWVYSGLGLSAAGAIAVGVRRNRPDAARAWWLLCLAQLAAVTGDVVSLHLDGAFPSFGDVFYLLSYPLMGAGLVLLVRHRNPGRDVASLLDSSIITLGLGVLVWDLAMEPYTRDHALSLLEKGISVGYPLMDLLLLGLVVRLMVGRGNRPAAFSMLMASFVCLAVADVIFGLVELGGSYGTATYLDIGWLAAYLLLGAAALHPSMRELTVPDREPRAVVGGGRLTLLGGALLLAPAVMFAEEARGHPVDGVVVVASGVLSVLVLVRMAGLVRDLRTAVVGYQRAEQTKEDFVSTVSHELRTPLTSIVGSVELLSDGEAGALSDDQLVMVRMVGRNSERLLTLIEELLTLSQISASSLCMGETPTDLTELVGTVQCVIGPTVDKRTLALSVETGPDLGFLVVDALQIERVLLNLLGNAVKFTPDGGRIELRAERIDADVVFTVTDTGIGIEADEQPYVFDRFFRATAAMDMAIQGTGLGLSIVKAIVEAHGGTTILRSSPEEGTTVIVRLPGSPGAAVAVADTAAVGDAPAGWPEAVNAGSR